MLYIYDGAMVSRRRREVRKEKLGDSKTVFFNAKSEGADWTLTGLDPVDHLVSSGKYLYLNFLSDGSVTRSGFKIQYDAGM